MDIFVYKSIEEMGKAAAEHAARIIRTAIAKNGKANIILATGTSQFETLNHLVKAEGIDWGRVVMFHLDEYIGLDPSHPASFRHYLKERFVDRVGKLNKVYFLDGSAENPEAESKRLNEIILKHPIDVALIGIGENGHLAFNDPPADFETDEPFIVVTLNEVCRAQQVGEGWFSSEGEVPGKAISMSIQHLLKSQALIVSVPERRKAPAVKRALEGEVMNMCPATILRRHPDCSLYLDDEAASLLSKQYGKEHEDIRIC